MTVRNLNFLLAPRSVALIGASSRSGSVGGVIAANLLGGGFQGPLMFVNPRQTTIRGHPVYPDVAALPSPPDLAVIATPPQTVPGLVAELGARGTRAAVVITAGFSEVAEGRALTRAMLEAARPHLLRILGPNCLGLMVPGAGLNASFAHVTPRAGRIALLAQSGAMLAAVLDWADGRGIGFSHLVSMGEMADVDFGDLLDHLAADAETSAILIYAESVTNSRKFMSAARTASRSKPVIIMKAGRHRETARAVASHTGALAGADDVYDAAFERAGLLRVFSLHELFEAVETLSTARRPGGEHLTILTNGGGLGILATDALIDDGGRLTELSADTVARLDAVLPRTWSRANPVDIIGDAPGERYAAALSILLQAPEVDAVLVLNCPTAVTSSADAARAVVDAAHETRRCVLTSWVGEALAQEARRLFQQHAIPTFETPESAVRAFTHLVRYRRGQELLMQTPPSVPEAFSPDVAAARAVVGRVLAEGRDMLTGPESREVLAAYGIPVLDMRSAATPQEAGAAAAALGRRVALKILSPDISHKSDVGGVVLGLEGAGETQAAAEAMLERVRRLRPEARIAGFTVEPMVRARHAHELIVGMVEDAQFGPVLLFGQGGVAVEVVADRAVALPPLNWTLARDLMGKTRVFKLLQGYRDHPPAAIDAIILTLLKVSQLVTDLAEVVELDINPLLADENGVVAIDARLRVRAAAQPGSARLAIKPYPRELEEAVEIAGRRLLMRPIRPEDEPALVAAFKRLSAETVRKRFFAPIKELTHAMAARLTQIDYDREMALILVDPGPAGQAEIYAVARISADPDGERAEFAITVRDDMAGRGLGRLLMRRTIDYARQRGIGEIFGDVLSDNAAMLDFVRHLGFRIHSEAARGGTVRVALDLRGAARERA
ncbi:MAG: bifunctional acetate--CoA ligase family protein/GNAT family N-acetyltransferase [Rhodospirillaceae bacterium]|nr:bifunctional acetate--CoA ligase family protein/GNAT family N-acetyltransferase [Rhodospirillaceae bacterium]